MYRETAPAVARAGASTSPRSERMANVYMATTTVTAGFIPATSTSQTAASAAPLILRERANSLTAKGSRSLVPSRAAVLQLPAPSTGGACREHNVPGGADDIQLRRPSGFCRRVHFDLPDINIIPVGGRRNCLAAAGLFLAMGMSLTGESTPVARGAILEADDDVELLEKVKEDRKKRLERQGVISSSGRETGYLQEVVNKLSKVGQAIDNGDLSAAGSILGPDAGAVWVKNVNAAFAKLSSRPEEKTEVDTFNVSLLSLIGSVAKKDVESSKLAFVTSASALEKWVTLTGLVAQLTGL